MRACSRGKRQPDREIAPHGYTGRCFLASCPSPMVEKDEQGCNAQEGVVMDIEQVDYGLLRTKYE